MTSIILNEKLYKKLIETGLESPNKEVCGLLLGKKENNNWIVEDFYQITNITNGLEIIDYQMNPQEVMNVLKNTTKFNKKADKELVGIWHTHPNGVAVPSYIDVDRVAYPVPYIIFGLGENKMKTYIIDKKNKNYTLIKTKILNNEE